MFFLGLILFVGLYCAVTTHLRLVVPRIFLLSVPHPKVGFEKHTPFGHLKVCDEHHGKRYQGWVSPRLGGPGEWTRRTRRSPRGAASVMQNSFDAWRAPCTGRMLW